MGTGRWRRMRLRRRTRREAATGVAAACGKEGKGDGDAEPCGARRREAVLRGCGCGMMEARQPGLRGDPADAP